MLKKLFATVVILSTLVGCGNGLKEGTVVEKWYEPERTWIMIIPIIISNGKTSFPIFVPMYYKDDEDFCIKIVGHNKEGKQVYRTFYLSEAAWKPIKYGDYFVLDKNAETSDYHHKKRLSNEERHKARESEPRDEIRREF